MFSFKTALIWKVYWSHKKTEYCHTSRAFDLNPMGIPTAAKMAAGVWFNVSDVNRMSSILCSDYYVTDEIRPR